MEFMLYKEVKGTFTKYIENQLALTFKWNQEQENNSRNLIYLYKIQTNYKRNPPLSTVLAQVLLFRMDYFKNMFNLNSSQIADQNKFQTKALASC